MWSALAALLALTGLAIQGWAVFFLGWRRAADLTTEPFDPVLPRLVLGGPFAYVLGRAVSALRLSDVVHHLMRAEGLVVNRKRTIGSIRHSDSKCAPNGARRSPGRGFRCRCPSDRMNGGLSIL
jgi:hypothetical protein